MADVAATPDSGAAGTEYQTVRALRRRGHEVDTVWSDSLPHRISNGNLHYLFELPSAYKKAMLDRMRNTHYDVVHVNQPHGFLAAKLLNQRWPRSIFVHRSHGLELRVVRDLAKWHEKFPQNETRSWPRIQASRTVAALLARHSRAIAKYANGHIVSASDCSAFLMDDLDVPAERIAVIPQAAPDVYIEKPLKSMSKERLVRLLYVGQHAYFKAPMIVAAVINRITEHNDLVEVTWVTSNAAHLQIYSMLSATSKKRVALLDWMPQEELIDVYDRHGIFLFPSFFEGFGKVFLEAMSRGLCVIAADNGGAKDVITHSENGFLVPTGDVAKMAQVCVDLLDSTDRAQSISRLATLRAREYTWDRVASETAVFYERLLNTTRSQLA